MEKLASCQNAGAHGICYPEEGVVEFFDCDSTERGQKLGFHIQEDGTMEVVVINSAKADSDAGEPCEVLQLNQVQTVALVGKILAMTKMHVTGGA